ncbi:hypothetical protein [Shewanella sp. SE1]|uniref:hypothetical protein n=1 Tax=Shewanella sp. SE1 TaxID=2705014 RepID=UPI00138EE48C|nr:hypothetical protein [Shewanella sp. SE1]NDO73077.1 hypothetical protein [Shewanella sp. SE1]
MTLPSTGTITAAMINTELGRLSNAPFDINGLEERELAGKPTGAISFSDFYGKTSTVIWSGLVGMDSWAGINRYGWDKGTSPIGVDYTNEFKLRGVIVNVHTLYARYGWIQNGTDPDTFEPIPPTEIWAGNLRFVGLLTATIKIKIGGYPELVLGQCAPLSGSTTHSGINFSKEICEKLYNQLRPNHGSKIDIYITAY